MTATQRYKCAVNRSIGASPATLRREKGFNWSNWAKEQPKNPVRFVLRKPPVTTH